MNEGAIPSADGARHVKRSGIVLGSLTGLVLCPALVAMTAVLVPDLRGPIFQDQGVLVLLASSAIGVVVGALVMSRMTRMKQRRRTVLGAITGAVLGAAVMGTSVLIVVVMGDGWPHGLSAFVTGAIFGAVLGGFLGGVIGFVQGGGVTPLAIDGRDHRR